MNDFREPTAEEAAVITALLGRFSDGWPDADPLRGVRVRTMDDGGMGSLLLVPGGA